MLHHLSFTIVWTQAISEPAIRLYWQAIRAARHLCAFSLGLCACALARLFKRLELASMLRGGLGAILALIISGRIAPMLEELVDLVHGLVDKAVSCLNILLDVLV